MTQNTHKTQMATILREARERSGLSMDDIAEQLGISKATLSRIETGGIAVTADRIAHMAGLYGLSVPDLMQGYIVGMPRQTDLKALHDVVKLIQNVILDLDVRPSSDKLADLVLASLEKEQQSRMNGEDTSDTALTTRHKALLTAALKP